MTDVDAGPTADPDAGGGRADADRAVEQIAAELRAAMVVGLIERGELSRPWRAAVKQVPRHRFLPDTIWTHDASLSGRDYAPLHRAADPDRWLRAAYANTSVITQVDDGVTDADGRGREVSSSASMPAVVAEMLTAVEAAPGMRVLEVGTGTGWNAALLAHRLGAANVVSVEIDPELADASRVRLDRAGYGAVTVLTAGDAAAAGPYGPYDRVLATVAARQIPPAWIAPVRPGGLVLLPWGTDWYPSALLRLDVDDACCARGRIVGDATFMQLRGQRSARESLPAEQREGTGATTSSTELHPWHVAGDPHAATAIGVRLPGIASYYVEDDPAGRLVIVERDGESWARLHTADAPPYRVEQGGPRRLWDEVTAAYQWWEDNGEPERGRWIVTVGPEGQRIDLGPSEGATTDPNADHASVASAARSSPTE